MNTSNIQEGLQGDIVGSKECMSCRIIGSATFAGVGIYALLQTRRSAPGSFAQKRIIGGLGAVMLVGSIIRWNSKCELPVL
ncbi:hypothetical protein Agabi119p4_1780 [Agaricus bisporus var. burnettii]|uniref:Distal membrane-arm assembly complex protein 1-like domain-containing protein n=1 Tax=Agaricus bisporus var. burnettii TaxID=192524 RepID=A0A8H7F7Z4_AGABI|nr:hypothetical protein Agabi119p4_1780 [Agaricus bisporus var. burnettii]